MSSTRTPRKMSHRLAVIPTIALAIIAFSLVAIPLASAESPYPASGFLDWYPPYVTYDTPGTVVETLGSINCLYNYYSAITATVNSINAGFNTITEITPQSYCGTLSQYATMIADITYIVNASAPNATSLWGGIMVDEEPGYASFSWYTQFNSTLNTDMLSSPGIEWWFNEIGACNMGCWSQSEYDQLLGSSYPAPQIYNQNFANYYNASGYTYQLVTYWPAIQTSFANLSTAVDAVGGTTYSQSGTYWYNQYQN